jgi:diguanylate cyclase (GGDEF)-like protein
LTKVDLATAALRDDIEQRKATEARLREREGELRHLAFHDPLTGLANRTLFYERVEHAVDTHTRSGSTLAVLFIDLDGFKQVNDSLGHHAGDTVLTEVAARLGRCVRASDTLARFGGDEFAVLAEQLTSPTDAKIIGEKVVQAMQKSFDVNDEPAKVTVSVGVAIHQPGTVTADDIVHRADDAMYHAKLCGKNRYFIAEAHDESLRHLSGAY